MDRDASLTVFSYGKTPSANTFPWKELRRLSLTNPDGKSDFARASWKQVAGERFGRSSVVRRLRR
jgi:hypothetical protein